MLVRQSPSSPTHSVMRQLAPLATLGIELVVTVLVGGAVGWVLDGVVQMRPVWTIVGFVLGIAAAIVQFVRAVRRLDQQPRNEQFHQSHTERH